MFMRFVLKSTKRRAPQHPYDAYRSLLRARLYSKLSKEKDELKQEGRFPFEGGWLSEAEVQQRLDLLKRRDRELRWDLLLCFLAAAAFITVLFLFLRYVL